MKRTKIDIRRAIKERGYSLSAFAEKSNMTLSNLSKNIINGNPTVKKLGEICEVLGCDITDLFYPLEEETKEQHEPDTAAPAGEDLSGKAVAVPQPSQTIQTTAFCPHCGARVKVGVVLMAE